MPPFRFRQLTEDEFEDIKHIPGLGGVEGTLGDKGLSYTFDDGEHSATFVVKPTSGVIDKFATFVPEGDNNLFDHEDVLHDALRVVDSSVGGRKRRRRGARKTHRKIKRTTRQTRRR